MVEHFTARQMVDGDDMIKAFGRNDCTGIGWVMNYDGMKLMNETMLSNRR